MGPFRGSRERGHDVGPLCARWSRIDRVRQVEGFVGLQGTLESNLAIGAKPVEFSGVSTDIDGYSPEALQVLIP